MAENQIRYVGNLNGAPGPLRKKGLFQAGSAQAVKQGEILVRNGSSQFVPISADEAMSAEVAIADSEIRSGDLAGYYDVIVPRDGDVFVVPLAAAAAPALGASLYYSGSQEVTTSGTNVLGYSVGDDHIPAQGHKSVDGSPDAGTTLQNTTQVLMVFKKSVSYYAALQG